MSRFSRFLALGAVLVAGMTSMWPAHAATTVRAATITSVESIGGIQVVYNAEAVQVVPGGVVAVNCEGVPVPAPQTHVWTACWLTNLDTADWYEYRAFEGGFGSGGVGGEVLVREGPLQLCMYVDVTVGTTEHFGPLRCQILD